MAEALDLWRISIFIALVPLGIWVILRCARAGVLGWWISMLSIVLTLLGIEHISPLLRWLLPNFHLMLGIVQLVSIASWLLLVYWAFYSKEIVYTFAYIRGCLIYRADFEDQIIARLGEAAK